MSSTTKMLEQNKIPPYFAIRKATLKKELFFLVGLLGILQAILVNMSPIKLPLLSGVMVCYLIYKIYQGTAVYNYAFLLLVFTLLVLLIWGTILDSTETKQIVFHLNVIVCLIFAKTITKECDIDLRNFTYFLWFYVIISLVIYFNFWDYFANKISSEDDLINLRSSGVKRSFGLLFNPLASAYFLLLSFYLLMARDEYKYTFLKIFIVISIILCFTRGAIVSLAVFSMSYLFYRRKWLVVIIAVAIVIIAYFVIEPLQILVNSIVTLEDSQGSAQGHVESLANALQVLKDSPQGVGFSSLAVESWVFNYSLRYGFMGIFVLLIPWSYLIVRMLLRYQILNALIFFSFLPVVFIIPFHTFNLAITQFYIMMYMFYYNFNYQNNHHEHRH